MRRMLQEAADGGYERLAWTTGAQQADRYSLAKHVDRLRYDPATQSLTGYKGRSLGPIFEETVAPDKLAEYIGEEPAAKLLAAKPPRAIDNIGKDDRGWFLGDGSSVVRF